MSNHGGMRRNRDIATTKATHNRTDVVTQRIANADALKIWKTDRTVFAFHVRRFWVRKVQDGNEGDGYILPERYKTRCRFVQIRV